MTSKTQLGRAPCQTAGGKLRVAIVDAGPSVLERLEPTLRAAGFEMLGACLADYPNGASALSSLRAGGAALVVYELDQCYLQAPERFLDFYAAVENTRTSLIISTLARWCDEARSPKTAPGAISDERMPFALLLRAIQRALEHSELQT